MSTVQNIQPITPPIIISNPQTYDNMVIQLNNITLGVSATINVLLYSGNSYVTNKILILKDDDYKNWGSDDSYITTWVNSQLQNEFTK
jgi:hypothetical protein